MLHTDHEIINSPLRKIVGKAEFFQNSVESAYGKYVTFEDVDHESKVKVKLTSTDGADIVGSTITVGGKNLVDTSQMTTENETAAKYASFVENGDGTFTLTKKGASGWQTKTFPLFIPANTPFSISANVLNQDKAFTIGIVRTDDWWGRLANRTYTEPYDIVGVFLYYSQGEADGISATFTDFQIELGSTASEYEPFKEPTVYTIDETLTVEAFPYSPTTVIYPNNAGVFIEKAECTVCKCGDTYAYDGDLQEIGIDRIGEDGKFFGFGICQKLTLKVRDLERSKNPTTNDRFLVYFGADEDSYTNAFPFFNVEEVERDENTNSLTITAYDMIHEMERHTVAELGLSSYTLKEFATACARMFGLSVSLRGLEDASCFDIAYEQGANFEGTETIKEAITDIAEATQTIFFVTRDELVFKRLGGASDLTIDKSIYFELKSGEAKSIQAICNTTELDESVTASTGGEGVTQYIRDNAFLDLREDITTILDNAVASVAGLSIAQFNCKWRGNYLLEIGDKLDLITKDNEVISSYLLNDSVTYNGAFSQNTEWNYTDSGNETTNNPTTLGEAVKRTFAKVDKANKQIELVVSKTNTNADAISILQLNEGKILASVSSLETDLADKTENANNEIAELKKSVEAQITDEDVTITIQTEMAKGVDKVITSVGYQLTDEGLNITKSDSDVSTVINHEGMRVASGGEEKLSATNEGVEAVNLKATNFLIVDGKSRFESYGNRTGCFWIGGN